MRSLKILGLALGSALLLPTLAMADTGWYIDGTLGQAMVDDNERIFAALCMGASGYILKSTPADKILEVG